jgi:integrase
MATFKICVFKHQKRRDGKYPVSIQVYWKKKCSFIGTEYYVTDKQVSKRKFLRNGEKREAIELKDIYVINELNRRIEKFENLKAQKLGLRIELYSSKELAEYFEKETKPGSDAKIDFIEFARNYIDKLKAQKRNSTAQNLNRTINAVIDFCNGRDKIAITEVTAKFLNQFEEYLKGERTLKRKNQFGKVVTTKKEGLSDISLYDYMNDIRVLFNEAVKEYNDEDKEEIRITHYPFRKYKLKPRKENEKRNITIEQIQKIRDIESDKLILKRTIFARDVFLLSFYLVGMNFADLYELDKYKDGRVSYERRKTRDRRKDRALISIKVEPEALQLFEKYRDKTGVRVFDFYKRYSTSHDFSSNVNKGLKKLATVCEINEELSTYYARHSWATIARNKCDISRDDIDLALNHVDQDLKITDMYIEKDWSKIDKANRTVIDYLNMPPLPVNNQSAEMPKSVTK